MIVKEEVNNIVNPEYGCKQIFKTFSHKKKTTPFTYPQQLITFFNEYKMIVEFLQFFFAAAKCHPDILVYFYSSF